MLDEVLHNHYIPRQFLHQTGFPGAFDKDLLFAVCQIAEKWRRHFPIIGYYSIKKGIGIASGVDAELGGPAPVGSGDTFSPGGYDPIYGEPVDPQMVIDGKWDQAHLSADYDATSNNEQYREAVHFHAQVRRQVKERELKLYGFDKIRDIVVTIPASFFDACGFRAQEYDAFIWDGEEYSVVQRAGAGWWHNSNTRLYQVLNCENRRLGS